MRELVYDVKEVRTIRELLNHCVSQYSENTAFVLKDSDGNLFEKSFNTLNIEVKLLSTYLNSLGLENKKIAIMGNNCYEWALSYLAICSGTGIVVPIDKELKCEEVANILKISECSAIIYTKSVSETIEKCKNLVRNITPISTDSFNEAMIVAERLIENGNRSYDNHKTDPDSLGILIYTSGTTGLAKGVMLSQNNICSNVYLTRKSVYIDESDRAISILPLHHTYECTLGFLAMLYSGASIAYLESLRKLVTDFALYKPTVFISVPLLLENIHSKIMKKLSNTPHGKTAFNLGKKAVWFGDIVNFNFRKAVFGKIQETFGGKLRLIICGAASLRREICKDFQDFGLTVLMGYGLTEASPLCIGNNDFNITYDSVGKPINGVSVKLIDPGPDGVGEIAVKGPNIMLGYYKSPEETEKVLRDGWFYTGDLGKKGSDGNYRITGRVKNLIVTQNGKKIFPEEIEYYLQKSKYIKECMVFGRETEDKQTVVEAIVYPDFDEINQHLSKSGITPESESYSNELKALFSGIVKETNSFVPNYKAIRRFVIRKNEFEKTTTKKIKRFSSENTDGTDNIE